MDPIRFMQGYLDALARGEYERAGEFITSDYRFFDNGELWSDDSEGALNRARMFALAFPDGYQRLTRSRVSPDGTAVTAEFVFEGTHLGPFFGLEATGRRIRLRGVAHARMRDDRMSEAHMWWNMADLVQQLGMAV